ncbi:MAG: YggT family protein [Syntrophobacterales bacterium]|nr:MAG: YggT family protein [Syntrophobacterales bacterium]
MFVIGNFIEAIARIIDMGLTLYMWLIIIRALISWVNPDPNNPIIRFLYTVTEPVLYQVRRLIPIKGLGIDFAPVIVVLVIIFLQSFLVRTMLQIAVNFR